MKYDDTIKATARSYYVGLGMDSEKISRILGPTAKTINEWASDGEWEKQRKLKNSSTLSVGLHALAQINRIYEEAETEDRILDSKEVDMVSKHRKMMEGLNKDLAFVSNAIDGNGLFMELLREKDEELFNRVIEYSLEFTQSLVEKFGEV
jgi:predicted phage-related endonuclease